MHVAPLLGPADRRVVEVTGADRLSYLDAVLSQRLRDAEPGTATAALELGPHGEPTGALELAVLDERVVLLVPPAAEGTLERLSGRTFLSEATFEPRDDRQVLRLRASDAGAVLAAAGLPTTAGTAAEHGRVVVLVHDHGADLAGPADELDELTTALVDAGATRAEADDLDAAEVALGVPRMPEEVAPGRLPEELGLMPTHVHLDKGCYPGQEAVARMWMLGRPRRRLAVVDPAAGLAAGDVLGEGRTKVELTRVAELDGTRVALAFVPPATAEGDEPAQGVRVLRLVGADHDVPGHDPAVPRRRDR